MIKRIVVTVDTGDRIYSSMVYDGIEDAIWDKLHALGGVPILDKNDEPCGKMDIFGIKVEMEVEDV